MDEKKLSGLVVTRSGISGRFSPELYLLPAIVIVFFLSLILPGPLEAAKRDVPPGLTMNTKITPVLAAVQVTQGGGVSLVVRVRGYELPLPRAASAPGEAKLVLHWDGVRFPQSADKRDWWAGYDWDVFAPTPPATDSWWKQYDLPLLTRINVDPVDADSMRMTFTSSQPLVVDRIQGVAGVDEMVIMLKVYAPEKPAPAPEKPVQYPKGDPMGITSPVTLELRDADIKSVFRMLADMQKLNLLLDKSVPDMPVTFSFKGVPYNTAFSYLLRNSGLSYKVVDGMLVVGAAESLGQTLGTEIVRAYSLSYAIDESGNVRSDLTATLTGLISLSKPPSLDARNRQLYVTATEEQHREVAELLEKLDHPGRQVMLEARIFEVTDGGYQDLQSLMTAVYNHWIASFTGSGGLNAGYNYSTNGFEWDDWSLPVGGSIGGSPILETVNSMKLLSAGLSTMEQQGKGKNLANPSVITLDGQEADINLSTTTSYASGIDSNGNVTIAQVSYGPHINFLPVIGRDGFVTIKIQIEAAILVGMRQAGMGAQTPEVANRSVETTVRVRNGEPFVVGGLYQDIKTQERRRLPVIGYIPLLGDLLTYRHDERNKNEVAMIVIPYILDVPDDKMDTFDLRKTSFQ
ncbi:MAG: hypothetical protein LBR87_04530 [Synergistaceae bacterium]|jgi:type IV pilus assembly protein PilQ|nr:hypothetical protein [Synergistaceae bacterium]